MKVLMLGWEYPPNVTGGLGIACQGMAQALAKQGHHVSVLLPRVSGQKNRKNLSFINASKAQFRTSTTFAETTEARAVATLGLSKDLVPYLPSNLFRDTGKQAVRTVQPVETTELIGNIPLTGTYGDRLFSETKVYALVALEVVRSHQFDVVHAHDWLTLPAAKLIKENASLPVLAHMHSTEIDRNGAFANGEIMDIEKTGLKAVDGVIAVSHMEQRQLTERYAIPRKRIHIIPNGASTSRSFQQASNTQTIGFVGRFADQKAPLKFLDIARELRNRNNDLKFSMAGDGYMRPQVEERIQQLNLSGIVLTGFLTHSEVMKWLEGIDLVIVPSVAEPFGLVALEAINTGVPVVISRGAGITDFVPSMLQTDSWDIHGFTKQATRLLEDSKFRDEYVVKCKKKAASLTWGQTAKKLTELYDKETSDV